MNKVKGKHSLVNEMLEDIVVMVTDGNGFTAESINFASADH